MIKTVMHKNDEVLTYECDKRGIATKIENVARKDLLPFASVDESSYKLSLQIWLLERSIGKTRKDIEPLVAFYGVDYFRSQNYASLFDCYWVRNDESEVWEDICPQRNWDPENDSYFNLIHSPTEVESFSKASPNLTLSGVERRFWHVKDGVLGIITESSQADMAVYKAAKKLGLTSIVARRDYLVIKGTIYAFHPVKVSSSTERVPFSMYYDQVADDSKTKIQNLEACCNRFGIKGWKEFFKGVMTVDQEVGNKDRGLSEIGVLRNADTLEVLGFEPI